MNLQNHNQQVHTTCLVLKQVLLKERQLVINIEQ